MNARASVVRNGGKTNTVAGGMTKFFPKAAPGQQVARGMVNIRCLHARANCREGRLSRIKHSTVNALLLFINAPQGVGTRNVAPVAVRIGVAVDEDQVGAGDLAIARSCERAVCLGRVWPRHAEGKAVSALAASVACTLKRQIHTENSRNLGFVHTGLQPR